MISFCKKYVPYNERDNTQERNSSCLHLKLH
nr:MAG TPA: hypothetical protein [Caudoviricetes sp.]